MSNALSQGWRRSIWGIIGQQLALIVHVVIVAAGVGLIVIAVMIVSATVTIGVTSSAPTEGKVDKAQLVFGPTDWMTPQTVTVTGQDDAIADLDKAYDIALAKPATTDTAYAALAASFFETCR